MRAPVDRLLNALAAEANALREITPLLEEKRRALLDADPKALDAVLGRLGPALRDVAFLERARLDALQEISRGLGPDVMALSLGRLAEHAPAFADRLLAQGRQLREAAQTVAVLNERNGRIARTGIELLGRLKTALLGAGMGGETPTYGPGAKAGVAASAPRVLDRQA